MKPIVTALIFLFCAFAQASPQQFKCRFHNLQEDDQEVTISHFDSIAGIFSSGHFRISLTDAADPFYFERLEQEKVLTAPIEQGFRFKGKSIFGTLTLRNQVLILNLGGKDGYGKKIRVWDFVCRPFSSSPSAW